MLSRHSKSPGSSWRNLWLSTRTYAHLAVFPASKCKECSFSLLTAKADDLFQHRQVPRSSLRRTVCVTACHVQKGDQILTSKATSFLTKGAHMEGGVKVPPPQRTIQNGVANVVAYHLQCQACEAPVLRLIAAQTMDEGTPIICRTEANALRADLTIIAQFDGSCRHAGTPAASAGAGIHVSMFDGTHSEDLFTQAMPLPAATDAAEGGSFHKPRLQLPAVLPWHRYVVVVV